MVSAELMSVAKRAFSAGTWIISLAPVKERGPQPYVLDFLQVCSGCPDERNTSASVCVRAGAGSQPIRAACLSDERQQFAQLGSQVLLFLGLELIIFWHRQSVFSSLRWSLRNGMELRVTREHAREPRGFRSDHEPPSSTVSSPLFTVIQQPSSDGGLLCIPVATCSREKQHPSVHPTPACLTPRRPPYPRGRPSRE